jgi:diketogulonate reductase-like aldo/keto reductase
LAAERSLNRLGTAYLDLYLLHGPSLETPIAETIKALDFLVKQGIVKNIGVSNFSAERLSEAQKYTTNKIVVNQVQYSLQVREAESRGVLKYCQENDIALIAWRPLALGELTHNDSDTLRQVALRHSATPAQIAIAWLISQENVGTIFKCSNPLHLKENIHALKIKLTDLEIEALRKDFPNQVFVPKRPLL